MRLWSIGHSALRGLTNVFSLFHFNIDTMHRISLLTLFAAITATCLALNVENNAGLLSKKISDKSITSLTVTGTLDVRDLGFIADSLPNLTTLNIEKASIVAYQDVDATTQVIKKTCRANEIPATTFFGKKYSTVVLPADLKAIGLGAFAGCKNLKTLTLPATLDSIAAFSFNGCAELESITVPNGVRHIGEGAFSHDTKLTTVNIEASDKAITISKDAFMGCTALQTLTLGKGVKTIGAGAFKGCTAVFTPSLAPGIALTSIGEGAFLQSGCTDFDLASCQHLTTIGAWAFACSGIKKAEIPETVEAVGDGAFFYTTSLSRVVLPSTKLKKISSYLLAGSAVANDTISSYTASIDTIGVYAFYNADKVKKIIIAPSTASVGFKAMAGTTSLGELWAAPKEVPATADSVWSGIDQKKVTLYVYDSAISDYKAADQWKEFQIEGVPTMSVSKPVADASAVKAFFQSTILHVKATVPVSAIQIHDVSGILLSSTRHNASEVTIETADYTGKFYLVTVTLENGEKQTFKLLRK